MVRIEPRRVTSNPVDDDEERVLFISGRAEAKGEIGGSAPGYGNATAGGQQSILVECRVQILKVLDFLHRYLECDNTYTSTPLSQPNPR